MLLVKFDRRVNHWLQLPVKYLVKVIGFVPGAVISNPILREVIGTDTFRAIYGPHLRMTLLCRLGLPFRLFLCLKRARNTRNAASRFWICDFSFCILTTIPVGI